MGSVEEGMEDKYPANIQHLVITPLPVILNSNNSHPYFLSWQLSKWFA